MSPLHVSAEVSDALRAGAPVVALESTVIAHGLPRPHNLEMATTVETKLRAAGVTPATVGIVDGRVVVGLSQADVEQIATHDGIAKVSLRDVAAVVASGAPGATTVAATLWAADKAGIQVMATGGIGGVHGGEDFDESADLVALSRHSLGVVCSGAKSILDLPRTLERLETLGVPVIGFRTSRIPAFYSLDSGLATSARVEDPASAARLVIAQRELDVGAAVVFANPPPADVALDWNEIQGLVAEAGEAARVAGIRGKDASPFMLNWIAEKSGGRSLHANLALLEANATLAGEIAVALAAG